MSSPPNRHSGNKIFSLWLLAALVCAFGFFWAYGWIDKGGRSMAESPDAKKAPAEARPVNSGYLPADPPLTDIPPFDPDASRYVLTAWSSQGMLHVTDAEPLWAMLKPGSVLLAQLIKRGPGPEAVFKDVTIKYYFTPDQNLVFSGGKKSAESGELTLQPGSAVFSSAPIPLLPYAGGDKFAPYPVATVEAYDKQGVLLAKSKAVVPVSTEMGCKNCHKGEWKVDGKAGISQTTALDVLKTHDRINGTTLTPGSGKGRLENCYACHQSGRKDNNSADGSLLNLSAAIHGWHASYLSGQGGEACAKCHPSDPEGSTRFMRDLHKDKALNCRNCHGYMEDHALALLKSEQKLGKKNAAKLMEPLKPRTLPLDKIEPRKPWSQQPDCTGCHDFTTKPYSQTANAFNKWTKGNDDLFAMRLDNSGLLRCPACHGAQHAVYPARNPYERDRDNMIPLQYQGQARPLGAVGKCVVCHGEPMEGSIHHDLVIVPSRKVTIPAGAKPVRPVVSFPHVAHRGMDCSVCHHTGYVDGKSLSCSSRGCHDKPAAETPDAAMNPFYYRNAFHGKGRGCMPCHQKLLSEGKAAGPVACKDCHQ